MRINRTKKQKEATYQVVLDILKLYPCYNAFLISADLDNQKFEIGIELFREIIRISPRVPNKEFVAPPHNDALVTFLKQLGYKGSLDLIFDMYVDHMYQPWRTFATIINKCLSGKTSGNDRLRQSRAQILCGLIYKKNVDFAELIWEDIKHYSLINTIKDDGVLGKLKFVNKGEDEKKYGMSIPDLIMNDDIKDLVAYLTYLALSTGIELPKKGRGPDVALKLGESSASDEEAIEANGEEKAAQLAFDLKKISKANRRTYIIQQQSTGLSEGDSITPEVPDETKDNSAAQADDDD
ncbi:hypothetical protein Tco_0713685 [Tanacetum coccineum]